MTLPTNDLTVHQCGPDAPCAVDGLPCDEDGFASGKDPFIFDDRGNRIGGGCTWGSVCCSRCGRTAMENDAWR